MGGNEVFDGTVFIIYNIGQFFRLMRKSHGKEAPVVERFRGKGGNVWMHTTLVVKHSNHIVVVAVLLVKTFEEGVAAVGQANLAEQGRRDCRPFLTLHHHRRQLLVVAYHNESIDGRGCKNAHNLRFQYLRCLVENGHLEVLQSEECSMAVHRCHRGDKDGSVLYLLRDLLTISQPLDGMGKKVALIWRCAGQFTAQTDVIEC